jgi:hypothetical protein
MSCRLLGKVLLHAFWKRQQTDFNEQSLVQRHMQPAQTLFCASTAAVVCHCNAVTLFLRPLAPTPSCPRCWQQMQPWLMQ